MWRRQSMPPVAGPGQGAPGTDRVDEWRRGLVADRTLTGTGPGPGQGAPGGGWTANKVSNITPGPGNMSTITHTYSSEGGRGVAK